MIRIIITAVLIAYLFLTTFQFLRVNSKLFSSPLVPVFRDQVAFDNLDRAIKSDPPRLVGIKETRILHNKPLTYLNAFFIQLSRATDLAFLFSLSSWSSLYDNSGPHPVLFPWEFLFFATAIIVLLRRRRISKKTLRLLFAFLFTSLVIAALFSPYFHPLKLLPLVISLRLLIVFGIWNLIASLRWSKE